MSETTNRMALGWSHEIRATMKLAWPVVLTNVSQMVLNVTDLALTGWLGPKALAAAALGHNLHFALMIFGIGLVTATSPMIAIELGRKRHSVRDVRRSVRQGIWAAATISVPIWVILWQGEAIFLLMGQDPDAAREGGRYLRTLQWSILPFLIYLVLRNFVSALERPVAAMIVATAAIPINAILVWALIFGRLGLPELGLPGAGIGTTITNTLMALGLVAFAYGDRKFKRYQLLGRFWRPDWQRYREVWRIGLPIAITLLFEVTIFNAAAFLMGIIGVEDLAAHAIAIQVAGLIFMVPLGLGMAATVRVGLAYGRGDPGGVARAGWTSYYMAMIYAVLAAILLFVAGRPIVGLFLDLSVPENQAVISLAVVFLVYAGLFQLGDAGQAVGLGMLRGLGDTRVPMIMGALGYWGIGLTTSVVLGFWAGLEGIGIWIGLVLGLAVVWLMLTWRWMNRERLGIAGPAKIRGVEAESGVTPV